MLVWQYAFVFLQKTKVFFAEHESQTSFSQLEELEYADEICLLSGNRRKVGLRINPEKTILTKINTPTEVAMIVEDKELGNILVFRHTTKEDL